MRRSKPVVALVGRPNVGKSTLFNRLTGRPTAIVENIPGTTRDRIYGETEWNGVAFQVIDTGGLESPAAMDDARQPIISQSDSDSALFVEHIQNQVKLAIDEADAVIMVVDGRSGMTAADLEVAAALRLTNKPLFVAVNKAEGTVQQLNAVDFWNLGLSEPVAISAYHGDGVGDLLDEVVKVLPPSPPDDEIEETVGIAIVGRPNVGKSSLLNALTGTERAIVSSVPGTTRDPIDMELTVDGRKITLIDTAGIRRRGKVEQGIEQYSVLRSMRSIDRADVALLLIDANEGVTAQDTHIAGYVLEKQKSVVIVINKWDAVEKDSNTMNEFAEKVREQLNFLPYVPVIFISAKTRQRIHQVLPTALRVADARQFRMTTSQLNDLLRTAYDAVTPPHRHGRPLRLYFGTQVGNDPPTIIIFVNDDELVHFSYHRYIENRIREKFSFEGTPLRLIFRSRKDEENG